MSLRFDGRVAVVTGAGRGLGRAHALLLAARGARIVVNDLQGGSAEAVVREIAAAGGWAIAHPGEIATAAGADAAVAVALDVFGRLDIVVANAGVLRSAEPAATTDAMWDEVLGVNLRGGFLIARAAWTPMREQGYGRIVFTSSNSGLLGVPGSSAYGASKSGLWGLTRVLALDGAPHGIHANAVAPMAFTEMAAQSQLAPESWRRGEADAWATRLAPSAVSPAVAWLAHEDCEMNGEMLSAAGGRVARFFVGLTPGVVDDELTPESVRDHQAEIVAEEGYEVHARASAESSGLYRRIMRGLR